MSFLNYSVKLNFEHFKPYRCWKLIPNSNYSLLEMEIEFNRLSDFFVNKSLIKLFPDDSFGVNLFPSNVTHFIEVLKQEESIVDILPIPYEENEVCFFKPNGAVTIEGLLAHLCGSIGLPSDSLSLKEIVSKDYGEMIIVKCSSSVYRVLHQAKMRLSFHDKTVNLFDNSGILQCPYCKKYFIGDHRCNLDQICRNCARPYHTLDCRRRKRCTQCGSNHASSSGVCSLILPLVREGLAPFQFDIKDVYVHNCDLI